MAKNSNGIDAVFRELQGLDKKLRNKIIRQAQREAAKPLAAEIREQAPKDSGALSRSVKVRSGGRKKDTISTAVVVSGGHDDPFVGFIEFGSARAPANPFIRRSVASKRDEVIDTIAQKINDAIKREL
jgi:HK97 gp10 family phage protein